MCKFLFLRRGCFHLSCTSLCLRCCLFWSVCVYISASYVKTKMVCFRFPFVQESQFVALRVTFACSCVHYIRLIFFVKFWNKLIGKRQPFVFLSQICFEAIVRAIVCWLIVSFLFFFVATFWHDWKVLYCATRTNVRYTYSLLYYWYTLLL